MADTKEKLVSAAISLLEEGSEEEAGFTMRAIAQRAGVGLGCANYHFGSKEAVRPVKDHVRMIVRFPCFFLSVPYLSLIHI